MENSPTRETDHVVKFNGKTFPLWKFGCWLKLEQHNLVTIVNGTEPLPEQILNEDGEVINLEDIQDWMGRDIIARNYLVRTIEHQQQRTLINCRTAHEMWTRISAQHLQNAAENQHVLQHRFYEYQYQPNHRIMSHITEIETLASQLSDVGAPMTEIQIMTKIICTLPPSYRNFSTVWDSVPVNERTIALFTSRFLKEE
ncbi:uncharacterized protein LOC123466640 [Daphnia magna]|uniref:uncharacterized protein LOC123466640 n=1 Tax=Daphnia magna TaxID=35525 RepID=UPI001E1BAC99|nr:uncharacterized protein LOC123466640 [Daphnia magna]